MIALLYHAPVWSALGFALLIFGFAPGFLLRFIVLAFPRDDPRRRELLGEVHHVPRLERPFWVAEQFEVALVEGLGGRLLWAATGRIIDRWHLESGVERNRAYPDTFEIPSDEDKQLIQPGDLVKLLFELRDGWGERMWVEVTEVRKRRIVGRLWNTPAGIPRLWPNDKIKFNRDHVIGIVWEEDREQPEPETEQLHYHVIHDTCNGADQDGCSQRDQIGEGYQP